MATFIVLASAGIILFVSLYLALCRKYNDGIIGHFSLGGMAMASAAPLYEAYKGSDYEFLPTTALMYFAAAVFMARHAWLFRRRSSSGHGDWRDLSSQ